MNFAEEKTPAGFTLKMMYSKMKFLVFNNKGESVFADKEGRTLLHRMPNIVFVGSTFEIERDYDREFFLLKVRNNHIVLPYRDIVEKKRKFIFINYFSTVDLIPAIITHIRGYSSMLKNIAPNIEIDYLIYDETITDIEISVLVSRYKPFELINASKKKSEIAAPETREIPKELDLVNINTMSDNALFLASFHLKNMALSNLNQLLLDFEIPAFDAQYIIHRINDILEGKSAEDLVINRSMLIDLKNSFEFYLALIERDEDKIKNILSAETDAKKLAPYRTLVSKVRAMNPGKEGQLLYTEYENMLIDRIEELKNSARI